MKANKGVTVPYLLHEGELARMERINRRLWVISVIESAAVIIGIIAALKKSIVK